MDSKPCDLKAKPCDMEPEPCDMKPKPCNMKPKPCDMVIKPDDFYSIYDKNKTTNSIEIVTLNTGYKTKDIILHHPNYVRLIDM